MTPETQPPAIAAAPSTSAYRDLPAVRAALAHGVDLTLTFRNLFERSPRERLQALSEGAATLAFLRKHD